MKISITIIALLFLISCSNNTAKVNSQPGKFDSATTMVMYHINDLVYFDIAKRLTKDTFKLTAIDSLTSKKIWTKDTFYIINHPDSLRVGKHLPVLCPKELVLIDGGKNIDSIMRDLKLSYPKPDSIAQKNKLKDGTGIKDAIMTTKPMPKR